MQGAKNKTNKVKKAVAQATTKNVITSASPEKRYQMIAEAAYFRAEKRGFVGGDVAQDWLEAEKEIDMIL
jgi:Protein of unknown function (DUF2934)